MPCSGALTKDGTNAPAARADAFDVLTPAVPAPEAPGEYRIAVALNYRKVDQFLLNFLYGETNKLTAPVTEIARATATVKVKPRQQAALAPSAQMKALVVKEKP